MFGFCPLASGSKGNCIYLGGKQTRLLIDVGIAPSLVFDRLAEMGVDPKTIQAILVTHEHIDHIKGLAKLSAKLQIPIFANAETAKGIYAAFGERLRFKIFTTGEAFQFGDFEIHPFSIPHDTLDPVGFAIRMGALKLGICADLGHATSLVRKNLEQCDYLYLEANHEPSMVHASSRPPILKQRILGKQGHLSNQDCAALLHSIYHLGLKHVHLAHLSQECNTQEVALQTVKNRLEAENQSVSLSIAHQDQLSQPIFF